MTHEPVYRGIGVLETLRAEHREISDLLERCLGASDRERRATYRELRKKLLLHTKCEETEFYSLCEGKRQLQNLMRESEDDHQRIERLISQLDRHRVGEPRWKHAFVQLYNALGVHIVFEESQVFPVARQVLGGRKLVEIDESYRRLRQMVTRHSPKEARACDSQPGGSPR